MITPISIFVPGTPKPAGSKRGFYIQKKKRVIITDDCRGSKDWKTDVKHAAQAIYKGPLHECPIVLSLHFMVLRPKGHFRTGKNEGKLRDWARPFPISKPDVLKLARGVEDALTGVIWKDDAQIVTEHLYKRYADRPGVLIEITEQPI